MSFFSGLLQGAKNLFTESDEEKKKRKQFQDSVGRLFGGAEQAVSKVVAPVAQWTVFNPHHEEFAMQRAKNAPLISLGSLSNVAKDILYGDVPQQQRQKEVSDLINKKLNRQPGLGIGMSSTFLTKDEQKKFTPDELKKIKQVQNEQGKQQLMAMAGFTGTAPVEGDLLKTVASRLKISPEMAAEGIQQGSSAIFKSVGRQIEKRAAQPAANLIEQVGKGIGAAVSQKAEDLVATYPRVLGQDEIKLLQSQGATGKGIANLQLSIEKAYQEVERAAPAELGITSFRGVPVKTVEETAPYFETPRAKSFANSLTAKAPDFRVSLDSIDKAAGTWEGDIEPSFATKITGTAEDKTAYAAHHGQLGNQDAVGLFTQNASGAGAKYEFSGIKDPNAAIQLLQKHNISGSTYNPVTKTLSIWDEDGSLLNNMLNYSKELGINPTITKGDVQFIEKSSYQKILDNYAAKGGAVRSSVLPQMGEATGQAGIPETVTAGAPRAFLQTVQESTTPLTTPALKEAAANLPQTRSPITNPDTLKAATTRISQGLDAAHSYVISDVAPDAEKVATAQLLIGKYADVGLLDKASEILDSVTGQLTRSGQAIQAASLWDKLSPENIVKLADKEAAKVKQVLPQQFRQELIQRANEIQKMVPGSEEKATAVQQLWHDVANHLPTTWSEWLRNYRYQNMLSSPISAEKIGWGGLFNSMVTRPVDLFGAATMQGIKKLGTSVLQTPYERDVFFSDIPKWYKDTLLGIPNAWKAAVESFKSGNMSRTFEEGAPGNAIVGQLRRGNIPTILRPFTSLHGMIYSYFSTIVAGGEKARLISHGMDEAEATKLAQELGDKLTLRSPLGKGEGSKAVQAVDFIGDFVSKMNSSKSLGWATKWIAPFMKVSTNWAKLAVEHSPANLIDNPMNYTTDQVGKAFIGSVVTGVGAYLAAQGRVTWAPPTDKKESDLFYASGRKPYSVLINGTWIPMTYFGPFALSLAMPAAVRDASQGKNASTDTFTKVSKAAFDMSTFVVNNTPLPSIATFFNLVNGDTSINAPKFFADITSQAIPLEALQRYIANAIDPIYRKPATAGLAGFTQRLETGIPTLTKNLEPYTTPISKPGEKPVLPATTPEMRNITNFVAPYAMGFTNNAFEPALQLRGQKLESNAVKNAALKKADAEVLKSGQPQTIGTTYVYLEAGKVKHKTLGWGSGGGWK